MGSSAPAFFPSPRCAPAKNPRDFARTLFTSALQHKRLVLRPDDIFLPLLDAAATHVFQNGEASRSVFVSHQGQKVRADITRSLCVHYLIAAPACHPRRVWPTWFSSKREWLGGHTPWISRAIAWKRAGRFSECCPARIFHEW
jgi:hypothetical protein